MNSDFIEIKIGNIFDYIDDYDLLVNSSNKYMTYGSGICGQIFKRANKDKLETYCKNQFSNDMEINEVRITKGFDLNIDILHICTPKYHFNNNAIDDLIQSYENIFKKANDNGYKKIISISLGCGINGYQHKEIGNIIYNKLKSLTKDYNIKFCLVLESDILKNIYEK